MLGSQGDNTDLFQLVTMDALVPANHRLRRLKAILDLSFVRERVAARYSSVGRPSVDPEVVVRMWILQYLHGFSEREVCDEVQMHAGFRWFCGLSFNDRVPDQSTLVNLRMDKWAGSGLWDEVLQETVRACEEAGISRPDRVGVDGSQVLANAATVSLEEIPPVLTVVTTIETTVDTGEPFASERPHPPTDPPALRMEEGERPQGKHKSGDPDWHGAKFSNATHRSTTDPDARLYRKGHAQEAKLRYLIHYMADVSSGVIYDATATQATGMAEREATLAMLDRLRDNRDARPRELVADLGYRDGTFLSAVIERGVTPLVPIGNERLEKEPHWKRATKKPSIQKQREERLAVVRARNATRLASRGRRGAHAQKQRTRLEHLFAEAKEHHGMARAHGRGLVRVDQQLKLTAAIQNLKRLMATRRWKRAPAQAAAMSVGEQTALRIVHSRFRMPIQSRLSLKPAYLGCSQTRRGSIRTKATIVAARRQKRLFKSRF